ncbi:CDP-glycerol glycerophosphotransferase family protein [Microlunatus sp. Gsoil 973]|uniref:CDP-glycerol glycerophosphotransferase family protein n=1 Tax=Microlunatus sp. Gsoil 973 TaxID=2672569 RepID=UPI0012B501CA|nr:CDP-glycerol glycerophosphotransferase family protein [Microlunatus sp. Gsoil 973]QGN32462.1 glycosyltransferase [Microlunatus sp. Gsoil 973]
MTEQVVAQARQAGRQLAAQAARRLPPVARRGVRKSWQRLRPYAKRVFYSRIAAPLVSIVLPVYNVERYLPECLDSVLSQSYRHLQVILVDDGSPDRSIEIIRRYAAQDRRIQVIRQDNAGLGAARNAGARHARGSFLMFLDADDVLREDAILSYVRTIRRTGSDFVVGSYDRMDSNRRWPAASWIRSAHRFSRLGTTLAQSPDAVVNAVAWSKFYRRSFWEHHGFAFPEGVLYEDQALSARAYAEASTFDILAKVTYGWRVREDRSSITQQATLRNDLRDRLRAAESSLAELDRPGLEHVHAARLAQYLSNDFRLSIKTAQHADDEFWELLIDGLRRLTARATNEVWSKVSAQHRLAIMLVTKGHRSAAVDFVGLGHNNPKNMPALVRDGNVYLDPPVRQVLGLAATDPLLALAEHQLGLVSVIRRVWWDADHRWHVQGWAYIDNLDLAQVPTDPDDPAALHTLITAVEQTSGVEVPLEVELTPSVEVTAVSKHRYADYERSVFHAVFDVPAALARLRDDAGPRTPPGRNGRVGVDRSDWSLRVTVSAAGIRRIGPLIGPDTAGSPGRLLSEFLPDGRLVEVAHAARTGLRLSARRPPCVVAGVRLAGRELTLSVTGSQDIAPRHVELTATRSMQVLRASLERAGGGLRARVRIPPTGTDRESRERLRSETWTVSVVSNDGTRSPAVWPPEESHPELQPANPRPIRTASGNLGIVDEPAGVRIESAVITEQGLVLAGALIVGADEGSDNGPDQHSDLVLRLYSAKLQTSAAAAMTGPRRFTATLPLEADPWGFGQLPLASGEYEVTARLGDDAVPVRATDALISTLPITFRTPRLLGRIRLIKPDLIGLRLEPPLADTERGARRQQRLQDALRDRLSDPTYQPGAILLRSYYGEICGCNPAALHRYLHEYQKDHQLPGGPYTDYFAIKDYSVRVPEGAIGVLHDSAEWYRLLHDAQFLMDNMHQPIYHKKPAHQVQIQTFHGYPFKQMGRSHWARQNRDITHVRSYLERAADWDYLVSPAGYGSSALAREFGFPNTVLEIGYPRNDVLLSPVADKITAEVRGRLGIRSNQIAVLYGPTFRDTMSVDDSTAAMVDFLDVDRLADIVGRQFVIMVRGHAFNARLGTRVGSRRTIIDVTDYPDVADLCLASDAAILDYSSLRFDYGLTGKPMIFMVPDLVQYQTEARGSLWAYEPTAPGPLLTSTDEVGAALRDLDRIRDEYAAAYATFRRDYLDLDDGHATQRLVDAVFRAVDEPT